MLSYETLDSIADSVNPVLLLITLAIPWIPRYRPMLQPIRWLAAVLFVLAVVYAVQFLDAEIGLWPQWNGDYSTHSAFAIALVALWFFVTPVWFGSGLGVFALYATLMVYQQYHTWTDILTSAVAVGIVAWGIGRIAGPQRQRQQSH